METLKQFTPAKARTPEELEELRKAETLNFNRSDISEAVTLPKVDSVEYSEDLGMNVAVKMVEVENQSRDIALDKLEEEYGFSELHAEIDEWGIRLDPESLLSQMSEEMTEELLEEYSKNRDKGKINAITEDGEEAEPSEADIYQYLQEKVSREYRRNVDEKKKELAQEVVDRFSFDPDLKKAIANKYLINGWVGAGGMGSVYSAEHLGLERQEALKILQKKNGQPLDPDSVIRFKKEMVGLASINHPNVVKIFIGEITSEAAYFSMERVSGSDMHSLIYDGDPLQMLPENGKPGILDLAVDAAKGIIALHQNGIIHRDIKPANFVVSDAGVKVIDFGLIKKVKDAFSEHNTAPEVGLVDRPKLPVDVSADVTDENIVVGTPAYMSPEQIRGKKLSYQTDAFSFGMMLFEMATREAPFDGNSAIEIMQKIASEQLSSEKEALLDSAPQAYKDLVLGLMEKDPEKRMNMSKALQVLEELQGQEKKAVRRQKAQKALKEMQERDIMRQFEKDQLEIDKKQQAEVEREVRREKARAALRQMELNDAKRHSTRKRRDRLESTQSYEPAEEVAPTLPPPLIQRPSAKEMTQKTTKPNMFKRAWGGIKSLFGR